MDRKNEKLATVRRKLETRLDRADGFIGTSVVEGAPEGPCIVVYWDRAKIVHSSVVPTELDGITIRMIETSRIHTR